MQIAYHLGAHCTDEDRLLKSILKNRDALAREGTVVPGPSRYREPIREILNKLKGRPASAETQSALLDAIVDEEVAERVILSNQNFICQPNRVLGDGVLYPKGEYKVKWMRQLFSGEDVEFFMAICDPASFLPALFQATGGKDFEGFLQGTDPLALRWSEFFTRVMDVNPDARFTVWCNEDTPLIWHEVMRRLTGSEEDAQLDGGFDMTERIMSDEGVRRLRSYLDGHTPLSELQRRRIMMAFLDKFALVNEIETELDLPGWNPEYVGEISAAYEEDVFQIAAMEGITVLTG